MNDASKGINQFSQYYLKDLDKVPAGWWVMLSTIFSDDIYTDNIQVFTPVKRKSDLIKIFGNYGDYHNCTILKINKIGKLKEFI